MSFCNQIALSLPYLVQKYMNSVCAPSIWDEEMSAAMEKGDDEQVCMFYFSL